jgi:predicted pyridoxine 5'-phosphate oxidase superfamily flavin-nucleotide-binding protein
MIFYEERISEGVANRGILNYSTEFRWWFPVGVTHMPNRFKQTMSTPAVLAAQEHYYGRAAHAGPAPERDPLTDDERAFIAERDSFYLGTISASGWPYIQHRGGPKGFLCPLDAQTLVFADFGGNRQLLSTGNLATNDHVTLFLMDYPRRERLKILGHARVLDAKEHPELIKQVLSPGFEESQVERIFTIDVLSYDWNCSQFITPRYTAEEVETAVAPLRKRIAELEKELAGK